MIFNTEEGSKLGQIRVDMREIMHMDGNMVLEVINGMTEVSTPETGVKTKLVGLEFILG